MKIALLSPRGPLYKHRGGIWKKSLRYAPLTLTTLASLVPKEWGECVLYDEGVEKIPKHIDADIIGISIITGSAKRAYEIADDQRKRGKTVILGGVHPTLMPDEALEHADAVVLGSAEQSFPQLLEDFKKGKLKKVYKQKTTDLSKQPFPKRELLNPKDYVIINTFEATRGCNNNCEFCVSASMYGRPQQQKPIDDLIADIKQTKAKDVLFLDLNLIANIPYAKKLFSALQPLKVNWYGLSTVAIAWDDELLNLAADSGCKGLLIGFESISKDVLKRTNKIFNTHRDYYYVAERLHSKNIAIMGCFVFGLDGDGLDVFERTVEFCKKAKIDLPRFSICTPFPNTPLYNRLEKEGRITNKNWELYDGQHVVFAPKGMSQKELLINTERAWKKVYSIPSISQRLKGKKNLAFLLAANLGYRFYAHNLHKYYNCDTLLR